MSSIIRVLDEDTINKIAAGEVIENPASVVKELVENSLDAGATEITIEIRGGGRQLIRITDNGCGMNRDDALLCLERHATSKLKHIEGLQQAMTMGFRGEAIPSIASISKFTLITRLNQEVDTPGTIVMVDGGKLFHCDPVECQKGTTIEIKSLFFNVPVRKKFQKSPAFDVTEIQRMVSQLALGNCAVQFELISDQETLLLAPLNSKTLFLDQLEDRIYHLFGQEFLDSLIPIQFEMLSYKLLGYISRPTCTRHNRSGQHLFINRRGVIAPLINFAIREGYGTMLAKGRHPLYVIHLEMPADLLDVNVHPQKKEVRLRQERQLKEWIYASVSEALQKGEYLSVSSMMNPSIRLQETATAPYRPQFAIQAPPAWQPSELPVFSPKPIFEMPPTEKYVPEVKQDPAPPKELFEAPPLGLKFKVIAVIQKYIAAIDPESPEERIFLIDQKAAHARVIYETLLNKTSDALELQMLLIPHVLNYTPSEASNIREYLPELQQSGIQIKEFGHNSFVIDALPTVFGNIDLNELIEEIMRESPEGAYGEKASLAAEKKKKLAKAASRAAMQSKNRLSLGEAQMLLNQLAQCQCPSQCPSGKKVYVVMDGGAVARLF